MEAVVAPAAHAAAAGGGGGGGAGILPGTVAGRAAAAMVARAQAAAAAKQKKEEEEQQQEEKKEGGSSEEDEVFAASLKATAARLGKLGKVEGELGGGGERGRKKAASAQLLSRPGPAALFFNEEGIPSEYVCPISMGIMYEPVIATDGHSYEQAAIEEWIETRLRKGQLITSPFTNQPMARTLIPNLALRNLIRAFCAEQSLLFPTGPAVYRMG